MVDRISGFSELFQGPKDRITGNFSERVRHRAIRQIARRSGEFQRYLVRASALSPIEGEKEFRWIIVINSLRGIAALLVCLYHFVIITTIFINDQTVLDVFQFGKKGVQIFFVISGIVIPLSLIKTNYKIDSIGPYLLRRFVRIEPPYLVAVALGVIFLFVRNHIPSSAAIDLVPTFQEIVLHVGYLIPFFEGTEWISPVFWTLAIEFQYYIIIALFFPLALSSKVGLHWIFNGLILISPFLVPSTSIFMGWSSYFGLGIFYALYISKKYSIQEFILAMLLCSIVVYLKQGWVDLDRRIRSSINCSFSSGTSDKKVGLFFGKYHTRFILYIPSLD
ncbi:MAG: acyltransferase [Flavobacteriales bacterium]|nr:acyltransferase [Flavobacteriales bacterium]